jgi:hypothetical protein
MHLRTVQDVLVYIVGSVSDQDHPEPEIKKIHVLKCCLWGAGGFYCSLKALHGGLRIKISHFFITKFDFFSTVNIFPFFVIKQPGPGSGLAKKPGTGLSESGYVTVIVGQIPCHGFFAI